MNVLTVFNLYSLKLLITRRLHFDQKLQISTPSTMSGTGASGGSYYTYPCMYAHVVEGHSQAFMFYSPNEKCEACRVRLYSVLPTTQLTTRQLAGR
jgi:hypothetical protein